MAYRIRTLNAISAKGLSRLPAEYEVGSQVENADAWLVRSANLHSVEFPESLLAVSRAGAGTNTIPVNQLSGHGVVVFNTPGSNANAVKELVLAGLLLAARHIIPAAEFAGKLSGTQEQMNTAVEAGKKQFAGWELPGRTLGVIGLGAIGVQVCNAAEKLGMKVLGYDPAITIRHAWQLRSQVTRASSIEEVFKKSDALTVHVPLTEGTMNLVNAERLSLMKQRALILNFAREPIVDSQAMLEALDAGSIRGYVCDFPTPYLIGHPRVVALPHLGASTAEAEENSATMAVAELQDFLENGNITNSVNFPNAVLPREEGTSRVVIANVNVPNIVGKISTLIGASAINISNLLNKSRGELAWTLIDIKNPATDDLRAKLEQIEGVLKVRIIEP